ncbi:hypothetical protein DRO61_08500 [Candidatus Bathyarchaeota archaeon]|nr:MAG: hypothetical protein DRO61_08500 [Candidatus Bathyarchaeota archaeon]
MDKKQKADRLFNSVLKTIKSNWTYLKENPKHLAWCMMHFSLIHSVGRQMGECDNNPKYDLEWLEEWCEENSNDGNLLYDSWGVTVANGYEFPDLARNNVPKSEKINKTMEDWVDICTHEDYRYNSLFTDKKRVVDHYLCVNGTGIGWNKDGYLDDVSSCDTPNSAFYGYTMCENEVPKKIREKILSLKNDPYIKSNVDEYMRKVEINWSGNEAEQEIVSDIYKIRREVEEKCKELNMECADELVKRFEDAYKYCVYTIKISDIYDKMSDEAKEEARKTNIYKDKNYEFDFSDYTCLIPETIFSFTWQIEKHLKEIKEGEEVDLRECEHSSHVYSLWSDFVFKTEVPEDDIKDFEAIKEAIKKSVLSESDEDIKINDDLQKEMDKYRPNSKYRELYNKATDECCPESIDEMNKLVGYEEKYGFALFEEGTIHTALRRKESGLFGKPEGEYSTYYPMSPNYCRLSEIPDNAHESYFNACFDISIDILNHIDEEINTDYGQRHGNVKLSLEFLSKNAKRFNLKKFSFKYSVDDKNIDKWKKIASEIVYNDGQKCIVLGE